MPAETPTRNPRVVEALAKEFAAQAPYLGNVLEYLDARVPLPFVARYRKEKTGGADEGRLREIRDRRMSLRALEDRRTEVHALLAEQGDATAALRTRLAKARDLWAIEDLAFAYRPDGRSEVEQATETRLGPLAAAIESGRTGLSLADLAAPFMEGDDSLPDVESAVNAAVAILARRIFLDPAVRGRVREYFRSAGKLRATLITGADVQRKYETYHDFRQAVATAPSHRVLAVLRGAREKALDVGIEVGREKGLAILRRTWSHPDDHPWRLLLDRAAETAWDKFLAPGMESDLMREIKERADEDSVRIFSRNLEQLLLAPPAGKAVVMGVEPGIRRGCKIAVIDTDGSLRRHASIYPFADRGKAEGGKKTEAAKKTIGDFCRQYKVELIGIGSGPGCREVERFFRQIVREDEGLEARVAMVNEAGIAAFSGSRVAKREFPKLDNRVRAAVSLGRRMKDPLAEMVKIEPRSIGVGPYQRDVDQKLLDRCLSEVVESCAARVGVSLNDASEHLLCRVPGLTKKQAEAIVKHREEHGPFPTLVTLKNVDSVGDASWTVGVGFLRIAEGESALDRTGIHPENYELVEDMAGKLGLDPSELMGNERALAGLDPAGFAGDELGLPTVMDIFEQLMKNGGDPRGTYEPPEFREDLKEISDLEVGMTLDGVVTNIASFGAFVDVGVDQEGLVHVSELADDFVEDPGSIVSVGQRVKVRVLGVEQERKRLSLSCRSPGARRPQRGERGRPAGGGRGRPGKPGERPGKPGERPAGRGGQGGRRGPPRGGQGGGGRKPQKKGGGRPQGGRGGGRRDDDRRRGGGPRKPMIHEQKGKREAEEKIDPSLPEEEQYRLKLERLRKKFESGE